MVDQSADALDGVFRALADPTRRAMLQALAVQPRTVGELAAPFEISLAGVSKHIQMLERAGLIQREVQGRVHTCRLQAQPLHAGAEWLRHYAHFWNQKLDALAALLNAEDADKLTSKPPTKRSGPTRKTRRTS
jgi:DNA-binding transcriptional ArsR family regulator